MTELQRARALYIDALEANMRLQAEVERLKLLRFEQTSRILAELSAQYARHVSEIVTRSFFTPSQY